MIQGIEVKTYPVGKVKLMKVFLALLALSVVALVAAACVGTPSAGVTGTDEPTLSDSPIDFVMKDTYALGQDIEIKIKNNGASSYVYNKSYPACSNLEFYDESEETRQVERLSKIVELPPGLFIIPEGTHCDLVVEYQIKPGEEVVLLTWSQRECVKDSWGCAESVPVKPGKYTIVGKFPQPKVLSDPNALSYEKGNETVAEWSFTIGQSEQPQTVSPDGSKSSDYGLQSLIDDLGSAGATVKELNGPLSRHGFSVGGRRVAVNGEAIHVYEFQDKTTARREAGYVSPDGGTISVPLEGGDTRETHNDYISTPHFYYTDSVIVVYIGDDREVIGTLQNVLGPQFAGTPVSEHLAISEKQRVTSPDVAASDLTELVEGNTVFAFDLYQALSEEYGNLFYSPYSISLALAMTYAGARGETEQQMADTLHFTLPQRRLHPAFNGLDLELAGRGEGATGKDEKGFRLNIVNAIWGQEDYEFFAEFLDVLAKNYGAGLRLLDFVNTPEESRNTINDWVSEQTEGRIEDLIPQDVIDELTRLVLTNAIYFNAAWLYPFTESPTKDGAFHPLDGGEVMVPMMRRTAEFGLAKGDGYQAVELPYDGGEISMVILLPDTGRFEGIEDSLNADLVLTLTEGLVPTRVALTMPKFEFESKFNLVNTLEAMGMSVAFISSPGPCTFERADFSGMTGICELFIDEVVHKAFVSVDEAGTEAAAATAVVMGIESLPPSVTINRPFVFLIRDIETGAILFVGRVVDPSA